MKDKITDLTFEQALTELEKIVRDVDNGEISLEDSINAFARGAELKKFCEEKLQQAKLKIEKINVKANGEFEVAPANLPE